MKQHKQKRKRDDELLRKVWTISPVSRVVKSKTNYSRKNYKVSHDA